MLPLAHAGEILSFDWCDSGVGGGWLASAGLDRTVKVLGSFFGRQSGYSHGSLRLPF